MGGCFDLEKKKRTLDELNEEVSKPNFWNDIEEANKVTTRLNNIKKELSSIEEIKENIFLLEEYEAIFDETVVEEVDSLIKILEEKISNLEINTLLNGPYDESECYLEIHPGAGGTESCDWAAMLFRMYTMFCDKENYKYTILEEQKGEEAGIKSITLEISGLFSYGYFKCEQGVHRLVRISPFDSNKRRHTSFASVSVTPKLDKEIDIEINEKDLKIDVYRSSGNGGQGVNTTDSAVRITHLPSKIVVTCQNERSQLKNKEHCMKILKNKLYQLELTKQKEQESSFKSDENINFGSQIRSYVLEPYTLVKDNRSKYETRDASKVLDGDIKPFMESILKM